MRRAAITCLLAATALGCTAGRVASGRDGGGMDSGPRADAGPGADAGRRCSGCTDLESGACLRGTNDSACGPEGGTCDVCEAGEECVDRACVARASCGPEDCDGCCDGNACVTADSVVACGSGGAACVACAAGETCVDGMCEAEASCGPGDCSGCCDGAAACQTGDTDAACGTGGGACAACDAGDTCVDGVCTPPCAERCDGCCDGETCLEGDADLACGFGGGACEDCGVGSTCTFGVCVDRSCSDTCGGCCDGDLCRSGTLSDACGLAGDACIDCGASFDCVGGDCEVDPASRWNLRIVRASFSSLNPGGGSWDPSSGLPDPYCSAEASAADGTVYMGATARIDNTTSPAWDEVVLDTVPARDLRRGVTLRIKDYDTFSGDDDIVFCWWLPSHNAFRWGRLTLNCPARSSDPRTVSGTVTVSLERS